MLGVVEPMSCGIGGDLFVIYWDSKTQKLYGLNASGRSPLQLDARGLRRARDCGRFPTRARCRGRCPAASTAGKNCGRSSARRSSAELLAPAIAAAEEGFPVPEVIAGYWKGRPRVSPKWPDSRGDVSDRRPARAASGEIMKLPHLAATYRLIAEAGPDAFYRGTDRGEDRRLQRGERRLLLPARFRRSHVPTGSSRSRRTIAATTCGNCRRTAKGSPRWRCSTCWKRTTSQTSAGNSADYLHLFVEAKKLAFADRAKFYADPRFAAVAGDGADLQGVRQAAGGADRSRSRPRDDVPAGRSASWPTATRSISPSSTRIATAARSFRATTTASARRSSPATSASRCRIAARCSRSTTSISTASNRTSGRSTRSFRRWSRRTASRGSASA